MMDKWASRDEIEARLKEEPVGTHLIMEGDLGGNLVWHKFDEGSWRNAKKEASRSWWSMVDNENMAEIIHKYFGRSWSLS